MSDFLKIVTDALPIINRVQDNVRSAIPGRSDITEGFLVENASFPGEVNHGLGREAIGAIVVKQTDTGTDPLSVTATSSTTVTLACASSGTASIWVF